jgi:hypothetical protein
MNWKLVWENDKVIGVWEIEKEKKLTKVFILMSKKQYKACQRV